MLVLPYALIERRLREVVGNIVPDVEADVIQVRPCPNLKFGDYQSSALMTLAKSRKLDPRNLADAVLSRLDVGEWCEKAEVAGGGFLNFKLKLPAICDSLLAATRTGQLFFSKASPARTIVVDFSSPNVAKPMHVGHIRSTILGDCLARIFRLLSHNVITDNHLGDWGTQFGMLLVGWKRDRNLAALQADPSAEMERLYKKANAECAENPAMREAVKLELVKLQSGDAENLQLWREMTALSRTQFDAIYTRLGVKFDHTLGESFYNPRLAPLVEELVARGIARESEGAIAVFFDDIPQLKQHPALVRKSDGAFNYTTTDLATLAYRLADWHPHEIIYVTDARQQLHFQQLFAIFRRWQPKANTKLAHVWFGSILGEDGKPFKTRTGETIKLADLLYEAEQRALKVVTEKNPALSKTEREEIARVVGLGAVKYADLLPNRQSDYVFSWDKMLALNGNTAPYLQYAYTRIRSIFRKGEIKLPTLSTQHPALDLSTPEEIMLAKHLLNFGLILEAVADEYRPNFLCNYLYSLAGLFTRFYESCPVLKADSRTRNSRLILCDLTARVLKQGLFVLGIETLEQM